MSAPTTDDGATTLAELDAETDLPAGVRPPRANRTIVVVAVTAVVALVAGIVLGQLVISPAQRAAEAEPPEAGAITVPVEQRELSTDLTLRGDALYDDPVSVTVETADLGGPAIVTGQVPEVGDVVEAGQVVMEIAGRPVIVLPGELPVYRTLRIGSSGPDVTQLKEALAALGIDPGSTSEVFDAGTAAAVDVLYERVGYASPSAEEGAAEGLAAARENLRAAEESLSQARADLSRAQAGPPQSERLRQNSTVAQAERAVQAAIDGGEGREAVTQAREALAVARAERDEALAAPDVSGEVAARDAAAAAVDDAARAVDEAWRAARTPLPAAEIVYVDTLPRRVDSVSVSRGDTITGEALTISGATLQILASVSTADAALVTEGMTASLTVGDAEIEATVTEVGTRARSSNDGEDGDGGGGGGSSDRRQIVLVPVEISEEQRAAVVGSNVRVSIPMESTGGDVLVVPVAALTAGPGGESRVEVDRGADGVEILTVETGLTAGGYVEISGAGLALGDLVVVGR